MLGALVPHQEPHPVFVAGPVFTSLTHPSLGRLVPYIFAGGGAQRHDVSGCSTTKSPFELGHQDPKMMSRGFAVVLVSPSHTLTACVRLRFGMRNSELVDSKASI